MGVDSVFKAKPLDKIAYEELEAWTKVLQRESQELGNGVFWECTDGLQDYPYFEFFIPYGEFYWMIEIHSLMRYYGDGYERAHWPTVMWLGDRIATLMGERATLRYGSDSGNIDYESLEDWTEARKIRQAWWEKYGNRPYKENWKSYA